MYVSLYRRYRPQTFSDVVGQSAAKGVITRAIETGAIGHAYLFSGPRGCGKTTIARLFAKAVNCTNRHGAEPCNECETCKSILDGSCLDVIEIDGASNNSVDEIRDLKEHVALASFSCPYKVYIIDEVHMLSISAFNALLKTLEEPPERVIFILATTAPHKVPVTIRSRCQHIPFHGMTAEEIVNRLKYISQKEGLEAQDEALWEIARNSDGGMRDALSLAEQAIAFGTGNITRETIDKLLGGGSSSAIRSWITTCHAAPEDSLPELESMFRAGAVPEKFLSTLFVCVRNLWLQSRWGNSVISKLSLSEEERAWLSKEKDFLPPASLERLMAQISSLLPQVRRGLSNDVLIGLLTSWLLGAKEQNLNGYANTAPASSTSSTSRYPIKPLSAYLKPNTASSDAKVLADVKPNILPKKEPEITEIAAEVTPTAQESKPTPVDVSTLTEKSPSAWQKIQSSMADHPHVAFALTLADIVFLSDSKTIEVIFDSADSYAYSVLDNQKSASLAANILRDDKVDVEKVQVLCGKDRYSTYDTPLKKEEVKAESEPSKEEAPKAKPVFSIPDLPPQKPKGKKANAQSAVTSSNGGELMELLSSFYDGEVLYHRPHEKLEENEEEEN